MNILNKKNIKIALGIFFTFVLSICFLLNSSNEAIVTNADTLSTKKIEWGIKRAENHEQPDLGSVNKRIIDEANRNSNGRKRFKKGIPNI